MHKIAYIFLDKFFKPIAIFFFDLLDYFHQKRILRNLQKKNYEIEILIDVGSHHGLYTDLILKNFAVKKAFLFEPQKNIFKAIKKKYSKKKEVSVFNAAVSSVEKLKNIYINKHDLTSSLNKLNKKNVYLNFKAVLFGGSINEMIKDTYKVKTISLANFINKKRLKNVDLLKVDTEGHELEVLLGLKQKIKIIKIILIEFHSDIIYQNYKSEKIHNYLVKNNFELKEKMNFPFTEWEDRIYINRG